MTQIEVSFSVFLTIFVHFWPILAQFFDLYCTKIMSWAYFGTQVTPLAILHTPKSCLVALNDLKRAKNWLKLMFHTVCHRDGSDQLFPTLLKYVNYEGSWCIESELLSKKIPTCYYPLVNFQNYFSTSDR